MLRYLAKVRLAPRSVNLDTGDLSLIEDETGRARSEGGTNKDENSVTSCFQNKITRVMIVFSKKVRIATLLPPRVILAMVDAELLSQHPSQISQSQNNATTVTKTHTTINTTRY